MVDGLLETGQAARLLEVSPFRVRQLADAGALPVAMRTASGRTRRRGTADPPGNWSAAGCGCSGKPPADAKLALRFPQ